MNPTTMYLVTAVVSLVALVACFLLARSGVSRARRQGETRARSEKERADALFDASNSGVVVCNEQMDIVCCNPAAAGMGFRGVKTLRDQDREVVLPDEEHAQDEREKSFDAAATFHPLARVVETVLSENKAVRRVETPLMVMNGNVANTVWFRISGAPVALHGARHVILTFDDITEDKELRDVLNSMRVEVARLKSEIQCSNTEKAQYFVDMSHEIRTPLNGIVGMAGLLIDSGVSKEQREYIETIQRSSEALLVVMNDILDISKIDANRIVLEEETFDLQYCVEEAVRLVIPGAVTKHLEIICRVDENLYSVWVGDIGRIRQILVKLLDNAIKFTERGEIVVSVSGAPVNADRFRLDFAVQDTGIGIPPERLKTLFHPLGHMDEIPSETRHAGGSGLGLTVSKRLCELMGGSMHVESQGVPGHASVFRFSVVVKASLDVKGPVAIPTYPALTNKRVLIVDDNATSREQLTRLALFWKMLPTSVASASGALDWLRGSETFDLAVLDYEMPGMNGMKLAEAIRQLPNCRNLWLILLSPLGDRVTGGDRTWINACLTKPAAASRLHDAMARAFAVSPANGHREEKGYASMSGMAELHPLRILVAEDNVVNQRVAVSLLNKLGYRADVVADGMEVLDAVKNAKYDVILMDIQMPALDGEQATVRIRKEIPAARQPWIVAMTAHVMKGDSERYLAVGMNSYLPKPIRIEQLCEVLKTVHPLVACDASVMVTASRA